MHSSRMRTARSSSRLLGGEVCLSACWDTHLGVGLEPTDQVWAWNPPHPGQTPQLPPVWAWRLPCVGLETPQVWAWRPPPSRCGPGNSPQARPLNFPPGCGPGDLHGMLGYHPPPGDLQGMLGYHLQCMLGYHPPPRGQTDMCKNITFANFV